LKLAEILGKENAKMRMLQSTSITGTSASQYAEIAGASSPTTMLNGKITTSR
jgi:hypothetical protein